MLLDPPGGEPVGSENLSSHEYGLQFGWLCCVLVEVVLILRSRETSDGGVGTWRGPTEEGAGR